MKKSSLLRRGISLGCSAILLAGFMSISSLSAKAEPYHPTVGSTYMVNADSLNVRQGPGLNYARKGSLAYNSIIKILEINGSWGRIDSNSWIHLDFLRPTHEVVQGSGGYTAYVNVPVLNVRQGPGLQYQVCGQATKGYQLRILEKDGDWGKISDGWVFLDYVSRSSSPSSGSSSVPGYSDIQVNATVQVTADRLNVRQGPGLNYGKVCSIPNGYTATILEIRSGWGRISDGWISLNYVRPYSGHSQHVNNSEGYTAEVTADALNVRMGPGTNYQVSGLMTRGYRVTVLETKGSWGRISDGWICLDHVRKVR